MSMNEHFNMFKLQIISWIIVIFCGQEIFGNVVEATKELPLLSYNPNTEQSFLDKYVEENFKKPRIIIILCSLTDFTGNGSNNRSESFFAFDFKPNMEKPIYIMKYAHYVQTYKNDYMMNLIFKNSDILFLLDKSLDRSKNTNLLTQSLTNIDHTILVIDILVVKHKFNSELMGFSLFSMSMRYLYCGKKEMINQFFFPKTRQSAVVTKAKYDPGNCELNVLFILYSIMSSGWKEQMEFIKNHYIFKLFLMINKNLKLKFTISALSTKIGHYSVVIKDGEVTRTRYDPASLQFVFNDNHWPSRKPYQSKSLSSDAFTFLTSEKIVWVIVNYVESSTAWDKIIKRIVAILGLALLFFILSFTLSCIKSIKDILHFDTNVFVLIWSIFLGVSVPRQPQNSLIRILFMAWIISSSCITMFYYCDVLYDLTIPEIYTIQDQNAIIDSNIPMHIFSRDYANIAFLNSGRMKGKTQKYTYFFEQPGIKNETFPQYIENVIRSGKQSAILLDYSMARTTLSKFPGIQYYFLPKAVATYPVNFYTPVSDNFTAKIGKIARELVEVGEFDKLLKGYHGEDKKTFLQEADDVNDKIFISLYICIGVLYTFSILIFFSEILINQFHPNYQHT